MTTIGLRGWLICAVTLLAGCTTFEHPLVGETASPPDERLVGSWEGRFEEDDDVRLVVRRDGRADVTIAGSEADPKTDAETDTAPWLTSNIDGVLIANLGLEVDGKTYWKPALYELKKRDELRVYFCNDEIWFDAVKSGKLSGQAEKGRHGPSIHVDATQAEVREFLRANREKAFVDEPMVLRRKR
jgi:hypothetical protein